MIGVDTLLYCILFVIVVGLIFWLCHWLIGYVGLPEPFNKVARILLAVFAVFILISILLHALGHPIVRW